MRTKRTRPSLDDVLASIAYREYKAAHANYRQAWQRGVIGPINQRTDELDTAYWRLVDECHGYVHLIDECQRRDRAEWRDIARENNGFVTA